MGLRATSAPLIALALALAGCAADEPTAPVADEVASPTEASEPDEPVVDEPETVAETPGAFATLEDACVALLPAFGGGEVDVPVGFVSEDVLAGLAMEPQASQEDLRLDESAPACVVATGDGEMTVELLPDPGLGFIVLQLSFALAGDAAAQDAAFDVEAEAAARLANGELCEDATEPTGEVMALDVVDPNEPSGVLAEVACEFFAYQGTFDLLYVDAQGGVPVQAYAWDGTQPVPVPDFLGYAQNGELLEVVTLDRGVGDCGSVVAFANFGQGVLQPIEVRALGCDDADGTGPDAWPVVWTGGD